MKLGVFTPVLNSMSLEEALKFLSSNGVQTVELGAGGYPGNAHLDVKGILSDPKKVDETKALLAKYNMEISAISVHGNNVHPNKDIAQKFHDSFVDGVLVAEKLGVDTVITFSGAPGGSENDTQPNWVTCSWPPEYGEVLEYQWNKVLIPYWTEQAEFAKKHNINKIAFEMHPGFCVYNTQSMLKIREAVGDILGANFDPSHLFWQGMDPCASIRELKGAIHHFHAKDTNINQRNVAVNGVLDLSHYSDIAGRSWSFRTVGYGHDYLEWNNIISTLIATGYDGAISIEHEDPLMSPTEGLLKAIEFLKKVLIFEKPGEMYWA